MFSGSPNVSHYNVLSMEVLISQKDWKFNCTADLERTAKHFITKNRRNYLMSTAEGFKNIPQYKWKQNIFFHLMRFKIWIINNSYI